MTRRPPPRATTPQRDLDVLANLIKRCAIDVAEEATRRRDALSMDPENVPLVRATIDFQAAVEAYQRAIQP